MIGLFFSFRLTFNHCNQPVKTQSKPTMIVAPKLPPRKLLKSVPSLIELMANTEIGSCSTCNILPTHSTTPKSVKVANQSGNGDQKELRLYYASWCGYSMKFIKQHWDQFVSLAEQKFPDLQIKVIKCEGDQEASCAADGIKGYPTIRLLVKNKIHELSAPGTKPFPRTAQGLIAFVNHYSS